MKRYIVIWSIEDCCDSTRFEYETLKDAKYEAKEIFYNWIITEQANWSVIISEDEERYIPVLSEDEIERWDYMIYNCYVYIRELDKDGNVIDDEDYEYWLSDEEYEEIGWMEWSELKERNNW